MRTLTIFELLDLLETEIVSLRTRNLELQQNSPRTAEANGTLSRRVVTNKKHAKTTRAKEKKKPARKKMAKQLALHVEGGTSAEEQAKRTLGKRQALGKSLVQLRKKAATNGTS